MPCALVEAVEVGISGALLDDEDALAEAQQLIELTWRQLVETPPLRRDLRHAGLSSPSRRSSGSGGRGWRARSRSSPTRGRTLRSRCVLRIVTDIHREKMRQIPMIIDC